MPRKKGTETIAHPPCSLGMIGFIEIPPVYYVRRIVQDLFCFHRNPGLPPDIVTNITFSQNLHQPLHRRGGFDMTGAVPGQRFVDYFQPEQFRHLHALMTSTRVPSGINLFQDRARDAHLYYIHEGMVKIVNNTPSAEGIALSLKFAGDLLRELYPPPAPVHWADAIAMTDTLRGAIPNQESQA